MIQQEIQSIVNSKLSYEEKAKKLSEIITGRDVKELLPDDEMPALKEPLKPKTKGMKILHLSLHGVYFDAIQKGVKTVEFRDNNEYYQKRCTYTENGKTYLVPYDAITFYQGKQRSMTVALTNIISNSRYFVFYLGEILYPKKG